MPKNPIAPAIGRREALRLAASGRDGGTMRSAVRGDADHNAILRLVGNMGLTRWAPDFAKAIPNVAESWTTNQDASDDLLPDTAFYAAPPPQYVINSKLMRGEKMDDYTVRLIFAGPYLTFPERLAGPLGQHPVLYAKHYCSQFMPKYNPDIGKLLAETHQPDWATLFRQHCGDIETRRAGPTRRARCSIPGSSPHRTPAARWRSC